MKESELSSIGAYEAKVHFSELLERVATGEEILITKHGNPVARMVRAQRASASAIAASTSALLRKPSG